MDLISDAGRIDALSNTLAAAIGCDRNKVLRYAVGHAALSICWLRQDGASLNSPTAMERIALVQQIRKMIEQP